MNVVMDVLATDSVDSVYALAATHNVVYAARASGLYRSEDQGVTWTPLFTSFISEPLPTTAFCKAEGEQSVLLAGVAGGVLRSEDEGATWLFARFPAPSSSTITALCVSPTFAQDGVAIAATLEDGIFRTVDSGLTWLPQNYGLLDSCVLSLAVSPYFERDQTVFAGTSAGLFISRNAGRSWRVSKLDTTLGSVISIVGSPMGERGEVIFAGTENCGVWRSDDGGTYWTPLSSELLPNNVQQMGLSQFHQLLILANGRLFALQEDDSIVPVEAEVSTIVALALMGDGVWLADEEGQIRHRIFKTF